MASRHHEWIFGAQPPHQPCARSCWRPAIMSGYLARSRHTNPARVHDGGFQGLGIFRWASRRDSSRSMRMASPAWS